jgi:hypothetical protein
VMWKGKLPLILLVLLVRVLGFADEMRKYVSPDGKLTSLAILTGKTIDADRESRVEIRNSGSKILLTKSFASTDGEHGYVVYKADWTADSQFFLFSVYSSGGHQPWHSPIYFYCRSDNRLRLLDEYTGPVTDPNFELISPDIVRTSKLKPSGNFESVTIEAKLGDLVKQRPRQ